MCHVHMAMLIVSLYNFCKMQWLHELAKYNSTASTSM